jgi:DNA-binding beta-propeller fold protein YncE
VSSTRILGEGAFRYEVSAKPTNWGELPSDWEIGDVAAVGVDRKDFVYVFNRGEHPMLVFSPKGELLRTWGEGAFRRPHGVHMGPDDSIYCTDDGDHTVRKYSLDGKLLLQIGLSGKPAPFMSGAPFHRCTHTALSPRGDIYVADGYGNARVHKYSPDGKLLLSWGTAGSGPGEFNIVHNICCDAEGWVYVADRENHRVQVFDGNGKYEAQWNNVHRPCGLCMDSGAKPLFYVGELAPGQEFSNRNWPNLGPRVSILDSQGRLHARLGDYGGPGALSPFIGPHGVAVDSSGSIYVGELSGALVKKEGRPVEPGRERVCLQKLTRLSKDH